MTGARVYFITKIITKKKEQNNFQQNNNNNNPLQIDSSRERKKNRFENEFSSIKLPRSLNAHYVTRKTQGIHRHWQQQLTHIDSDSYSNSTILDARDTRHTKQFPHSQSRYLGRTTLYIV